MRVRFSTAAQLQFAAILAWLSERSPSAADRLSIGVAQVTEHLSAFPEAGPLRYKDIRVVPVKGFRYLIFYRIRGDDVEIVSIRHSARRPPRESDLT